MPCHDCPATTDCPPLVPSECFRVPGRHLFHRWLPAAALSLLFHGCLLLTIAAIHLPEPEQQSVFDDLLIDEIGNDPDLPVDYRLDRIDDINMPGAIDPVEAVGVAWATGKTPADIAWQAPPGLLPLHGELAVVDSPLGNPRPDSFSLRPAGFQGRSGATRERMIRESCCGLQRPVEPLPAPQLVQSAPAPVRRLIARPAFGVSSPYHPMVLEAIPHGQR